MLPVYLCIRLLPVCLSARLPRLPCLPVCQCALRLSSSCLCARLPSPSCWPFVCLHPIRQPVRVSDSSFCLLWICLPVCMSTSGYLPSACPCACLSPHRLPLSYLLECLFTLCLSAFCLLAFPTPTCPPPASFRLPLSALCLSARLPVGILCPPPSCPLLACLPLNCLSRPLAVYPSAYQLPACPNLLPARASTACQPPASLPVCKSSSWSSACLDSCFLILQAVSVYRCSFCFCKALYKFLAAQCTVQTYRKGTLFALC
jgi:hypothetical protein